MYCTLWGAPAGAEKVRFSTFPLLIPIGHLAVNGSLWTYPRYLTILFHRCKSKGIPRYLLPNGVIGSQHVQLLSTFSTLAQPTLCPSSAPTISTLPVLVGVSWSCCHMPRHDKIHHYKPWIGIELFTSEASLMLIQTI